MSTHMYSIGLSCNGSTPLDENTFYEMKEHGINCIELSCSSFDDVDFEAIKEAAEKTNMNLNSLHLPFLPFEKLDPSALDAEIQEYTFDFMADLIKKGSFIGIRKFIIHPSIEPILDELRPAKLEASALFLSKLADFAAQFGSVIAVENLPRTCLGKNSEEILYLISKNEKLHVCFDTNHLLAQNPVEFIKEAGSKIITTHISDYDFVNERHWLPGEGNVNWQDIFDTLQEIGYTGPWLYEVNLDPPKSIIRRQLTYKDFVENALSIFGGTVPEAIGKPIENLGFWC